VTLPLVSVKTLPVVTPTDAATWVRPAGTVVGASPAANVTVLPLTVKVSPAATPALASPALTEPLRRLAAVVAALITVPVSVPAMPPRVMPEAAACVPPAVPSYRTLLSAVALV